MIADRRRRGPGGERTAALDHQAPISGRNFVVRVADTGPRGGVAREWELPCSEVVLPTFRVGDRSDDHEHNLVVLRRGHTGSSELYDWWVSENDPKYRGSRTVVVMLLDDAREPVTEWRFTGCHLHAFHYSPLDAVASSVLIETAEVTFEHVTQHGA